MNPVRLLLATAGGALVFAGGSAGAPADVEIAPVTRLPFPERGYVVSVPDAVNLGAGTVEVRENGLRVAGVSVDALASSGLSFGVVLALDASESMTGAPARAALASGGGHSSRVERRLEAVGIVAFNGDISVLRTLTRDGSALRSALATQPRLGYGTRIHDGSGAVAPLLREAKLSSGSIVLLSDGADIGSQHSLDEAIATAKKQGVRIFTVGLRSRRFRCRPAPRDCRSHRWVVCRGSVGGGARIDLRSPRRAVGRRVPRPLPLCSAADVAGRSQHRGGQGWQRRNRLRRADAVPAGPVPPLTCVDVSLVGRLLRS